MSQMLRTFSQIRKLTRQNFILQPIQKNFVSSDDRPFDGGKKNELISLDPLELATGMYRKDILDKLGKDDDPYSVKMLKRASGTKDQPIMIPSAFESRMVGCVCEEDSSSIVWMWLHKGESKHCQCGHWFQLYYQPVFEEKSGLST